MLTTVELAYLPADLVVSPDGGTPNVTTLGETADDPSEIAVVDTNSLSAVDNISFGINPNQIAVTPTERACM